MKKIPTIFKRDPGNMSRVLNEPNPDCDWVFNGEGVATRKYDGTCCLVKDGKLFKRRMVKKGKKPPKGYVEVDFDKNTGKSFGWVPVTNSRENKYHLQAFGGRLFVDGTYELVGPKIQGNPDGYDSHILINHNDATIFIGVPRDFVRLGAWLSDRDIEGLVFHHLDGRMAKIKKSDFGYKR
jgi:hypothetical protein